MFQDMKKQTQQKRVTPDLRKKTSFTQPLAFFSPTGWKHTNHGKDTRIGKRMEKTLHPRFAHLSSEVQSPQTMSLQNTQHTGFPTSYYNGFPKLFSIVPAESLCPKATVIPSAPITPGPLTTGMMMCPPCPAIEPCPPAAPCPAPEPCPPAAPCPAPEPCPPAAPCPAPAQTSKPFLGEFMCVTSEVDFIVPTEKLPNDTPFALPTVEHASISTSDPIITQNVPFGLSLKKGYRFIVIVSFDAYFTSVNAFVEIGILLNNVLFQKSPAILASSNNSLNDDFPIHFEKTFFVATDEDTQLAVMPISSNVNPLDAAQIANVTLSALVVGSLQ